LNLKKWIVVAVLILIFIAGVYLVFTSGRFEVDPFTLVIFVLVLALIIYMYIMAQRFKNQ
jgi:cbb3-type cytochrome oxidase subunit 3